MDLGERIGLAIRLLRGDYKALATIVPTWQEGKAAYPEFIYENLVKHGWRKNELIFACISATADTAASLHLLVHDKKSGKELPDHPLQKLIESPNPFMDEFDFWSAVTIYTYLAGRAYFEKERNNAGRVIHLWPLRPDWVKPIRSSQKFISGYQYAPVGIQPVTLLTRDVLDISYFDPLNPYQSTPPVLVAARVGDVDNSATDFLKVFFQEGGVPAGYIKTKKKLMEADVERIRARLKERYGGHEKWQQPMIFDQDADWGRTGLTFKEMGFEVLDARNEARVCMVLRVPPIIVGATVGLERSTFANYKEARSSWWEDILLPRYRKYQSRLQSQIANEFGDNLELKFDLSDVAALQEETDAKWNRANQGMVSGWVTLNEARDHVGLPQVQGGDVFLRNFSLFEVPVVRPGKSAKMEEKRFQPVPIEIERERGKQIEGMSTTLKGYFNHQLERIVEGAKPLARNP